MSWKKVKIGDLLKQYRIEHRVDDKIIYKQVSILNDGSVVLRGSKIGKEIGRKRQFKIDTVKFPNTLIFTRQLLLQGSIGIASEEVNGCIVTENMPMFSIDTTKIDKEFLILFLKSEIFKSRIRLIELSGSAQKSIHERTFLNLDFFLPSIDVQRIIVAELLKLKSHSDNISAELTHQLTLVKKLHQQLLQDAVQGKLVKQSPQDEPASELLKKIKAEKAKLITEKKLRKEKELPPIKPEDIPFEIPENWVWCRLGEIVNLVTSGSRDWAKYYSSEGEIFVRMGNLSRDSYNLRMDKIQYVKPPKNQEGNRTRLEADDILISITGEVGNLGLVPKDFGEAYINQHTALVRLNNAIVVKYVCNLFLSRTLQEQFNAPQRGMKNSFRLSDIDYLLIPLPTLAEQTRIVQKLDELMKYCTDLETSIKESQSTNEKLLQQLLREALRGDNENKTEVKNISKAKNTKTKVVQLKPKKCDSSQKAILAGHIINLTNGEDFGRVKFQKLLYLTEQVCKLDLSSNYVQNVAGPYDGDLIRDVESTLKRFKFYDIRKGKDASKKVNYTALSSAPQLETFFQENFAQESTSINGLLKKFENSTWEDTEIVATLYAVWNNRIIKKELITDELLKQDFLKWDTKKAKYKTRLDGSLKWMRKENVVPDGFGKVIEKGL